MKLLPRLSDHGAIAHGLLVGCAALSVNIAARAVGQDEFASSVISYAPGSNAATGYTNPLSALGAPELLTGEGIDPSVVTPFQPAFLPSEIVSIGAGGQLTLGFSPPIVDHPGNPFGIDLIIFGNSFFIDAAYPQGVVGGLVADGGTIELSADGTSWISLPGLAADGHFPTLAFSDSGAYDSAVGSNATDPCRPVDPALGVDSLIGLSYAELIDAYDGGSGGTGVDIKAAGLESVVAVRITVAPGFNPNVEVDAISRVRPLVSRVDFNADGAVDGLDLARMLSAFGSPDPLADIDGNGIVDASDLTALLAGWSA